MHRRHVVVVSAVLVSLVATSASAQTAFFANLTGPGRIWLQSLPFSGIAGRVLANSSGGKEEGSVLGGLGRMLGGDNS